MVGYITIAHGTAQRLGEKWRRFACTSVVIIVVHLHFVLAWWMRLRLQKPGRPRPLQMAKRVSEWAMRDGESRDTALS